MSANQIESDIGYVKDLVTRSDREPTPVILYLLWAAIVLVGFALVDLAPKKVGLYWFIAGPLGGIVSGVLAHRADLRRGQIQREIGIRHALHWSGMLVVTALAVLLPITGHIPNPEVSRVILLVVAFGWWSAGVHFDRVFLWLGGLMMLGFVGTLVLSQYAWTILGVLIAIGLVIAAATRGRKHAIQER